ncbi:MULTISPECIES: hypothetical protein [Streptomyces]
MTGPEPEVYTPWETAQLALLVARAVKQGHRKVDRQIEAVKARAVAREAAADAVARERAAQKIRDKAAKRR